MPSTLSVALSVLAQQQPTPTPPTPAALLPLYTRLAGFPTASALSHTVPPSTATPPAEIDALVAFEHALDKSPAASRDIRALRRVYWRERLQACAASAVCLCCRDKVTVADLSGHLVVRDVDTLLAHILEEDTTPRQNLKRRRRLARAKRAQRLASEPRVSTAPRDPFAPSSSKSL